MLAVSEQSLVPGSVMAILSPELIGWIVALPVASSSRRLLSDALATRLQQPRTALRYGVRFSLTPVTSSPELIRSTDPSPSASRTRKQLFNTLALRDQAHPHWRLIATSMTSSTNSSTHHYLTCRGNPSPVPCFTPSPSLP
jgi:hypothetical protein